MSSENCTNGTKQIPALNEICLFCKNSMSADGMDGMEVLVCFDCAGYEGREMQVDEDETCVNFKGE